MNRSLSQFLIVTLFLAVSSLAKADVKLPPIFSDHMVIQSDVPVHVWGWAEPGEKVTVKLAAKEAAVTTGTDGKWRLQLEPLASGTGTLTMNVEGKNKLTVSDVLVGEVWLCSGQSNMEFGVGAASREKIELKDEPQIRLFTVPRNIQPFPSYGEMSTTSDDPPLTGKWQVATVDNVLNNGRWKGFSAVGYYFGLRIHNATNKPVGMISSVWGGTPATPWMSLEGLQTEPKLKGAADSVPKYRENYEQNKVLYATEMEKWKADVAEWEKKVGFPLNMYAYNVKQWGKQAKELEAEGKPVPPRPEQPPREPRDMANNNQTSTVLYNGMISPLVPYGIKGVLWYQGESNAGEPMKYLATLPALINDWRAKWGQGDFPFLVVQLPNYKPQAEDTTWAIMREAQKLATRSVPNTGMAVTIDIGIDRDIHPWDKYDVAERLALIALKQVYGQSDLIASGPTFKNQTIEGSKIRLNFDNIAGGLIIGNPPDHFYHSIRQKLPTEKPAELKGFVISGSDNKFVPAKAVIEGKDTVVVSADEVPNPVAVRYAWSDSPVCNLYNDAGLPAEPFRTDTLSLGDR
ncbi:MAG: hypothetical protein LBH01_02510 [Verrucomicrobiales bacterium]|jgi:sialate O-acetylesterase|nr:hypothetical protein [Verrucomicrobiales bacterium]